MVTRVARSRPAMEGNASGLVDQSCGVLAGGRENSAHDSASAEVANERAGIDARNDRDAVLGQELRRGFFRSPVAGDGGELAHGETFNVGTARFVIRFVGAVIADLRVGEDDDLAGV